VRLGYEFNIACRAFAAINVETSDLGNVPELLRHILEATLSQEASVESLERYLPRIRDIIINLLHGLKRKQQKLRQRAAKEGAAQSGEGGVPRNDSTASVGSVGTGLTNLLNEGLPEKYRDGDGPDARENSIRSRNDVPSRVPSAGPNGSPVRRAVPPRDASRASLASHESSISSTTMQGIPVDPPQIGNENAQPSTVAPILGDFPNPPVPPPKGVPLQNNALQALQREPDLQRRASRRYSQYQINKLVGSSAAPMPMLPPAQHTPIPNRGREYRESLNAVRGRGSMHGRQRSQTQLTGEESPEARNRIPSRISEGEEGSVTSNSSSLPTVVPPRDVPPADSPTVKTPEDKLRQPMSPFDRMSATLNGPLMDSGPALVPEASPVEAPEPQKKDPARAQEQPRAVTPELAADHAQFVPEDSPKPGKELTLFLQYKTKIKKFVLADGYNDLSIARLQLAFIEKFAWNTHNNGVDLPEIYIQDPVSGVRHELEDLADVKDRSVLVLNVEVLDEVKRHIDEGIGGLRKVVESVKTAVDDQNLTIRQVSERQQSTATEMARLAATSHSAPPRTMSMQETPRSNGQNFTTTTPKLAASQLVEIQSLRRDLAVLRQTYSNFQSTMESSMATIRTKAGAVKSAAVKAALPDLQGDSGRAYVDAGKKTLSEESDKLVARVDDLQDIVEDLRKDVVARGVRPRPRQLETVAKELQVATTELKKMQDFLKRERPLWTKIWEKELETVCNDREEVTMQEELAADLQDDLEKAAQTFALVEEATKEQLKDAKEGGSGGLGVGGVLPPLRGLPRSASGTGTNTPALDPALAKEGVLGEVRALQPNHENRLEAIERAEKLRQRELESRRGGEFQKELGDFVEAGKLKKSGGVEEVERARKAKDERIRREVWERQNGVTAAEGSGSSASDETVKGGGMAQGGLEVVGETAPAA
jgi:hypothetical protein